MPRKRENTYTDNLHLNITCYVTIPNEDIFLNYFCDDGGGWDVDEAGAGDLVAAVPDEFCAAGPVGAAGPVDGRPPLPAVGGKGGTC